MKIYDIENHLTSLWVPRVSEKTGKVTFKRSTTLIVPKMGWDNKAGQGSLNNSHWAYDVHYSFRDALDLSFDTRRRSIPVIDELGLPVIDEETKKPKKKSQPYQLWTQGFRIHFKEGDVLRSNQGFPTLQIQSSTAMDWDNENNKMFEGEVNYQYFKDVKFGHVGDIETVSQMQFLQILLHGTKHP
jgi:hypothetical protein